MEEQNKGHTTYTYEYRDPEAVQAQPNPGGNAASEGSDPFYLYSPPGKKRGLSSGVKALLIILAVLIGVIGLTVGCSKVIKEAVKDFAPIEDDYDFSHQYVGLIHVTGTITNGISKDGYSQDWMIERIRQMKEDENNEGIFLFVDTPGGDAYATREVYDELVAYREETERPIYVYMGSMAASGGYYISSVADQIYANSETWTGSIGVRAGTFYDISALLEKYGIKTYTITSGANKDMGSMYKPMTEEQMAILQGLVDDSYERFVDAVATGRGMDKDTVRTLADGRIYTAGQALDNGLIDGIMSLEEAQTKMANDCGLYVRFEDMQYRPRKTLLDEIMGSDAVNFRSKSDLAILQNLMEDDGTISIQYLADVKR